jgi:ADP-dependent phosphofructokinase/glucokinase
MRLMLYRNLINIPKVRVATGLYSHWDSIIKIYKKVLDWINIQRAVKPKDIVLNSIEEIAYSLKNSIKNGDSESLISEHAYHKLNSIFQKRKMRLGGNGNNMGRILFEVGIIPLVSYPIRPEKLMKASPGFKVACKNGFKVPKELIRKNDPDYEHIIFESDKWRNIFSWDLMTSKGIFDEDFLEFAFNPKFTDIAIISYAHLLLPKYKRRTDILLDNLKQKRSKIHLEFGVGSKESMVYAMKRFSEYEACDSWGMNEKECKTYLDAKTEKIKDLTESALKAVKDYNLERVCIHSSKFAFSVSKYDIKKEIDALTEGCRVASLKATGKLDLQKSKVIKKKLNGYNFCLVPSFFNPHLRKVTGLGDAFAAIQAVKILG